jgi:dipeptide/tripeptide permease
MSADSRPFWATLREDVLALKDAPRELWLIFAIKFFESVAYFAVYNLIAVYLSEQLHYSDLEAGSIAGTWLTIVSVLMFFAGFVADSVGIRRAMLTSVVSCLLGRALLAVSSSRIPALAGLLIQAWGVASMMPTMTAAVRRYTRTETVSFGFSLFYVMMNVGALVAPLTIGSFRKFVTKPVDLSLPVVGSFSWSSSQIIFALGTIATLVCLFLTLMIRDDAVIAPSQAAAPKQSPLRIMSEVVTEKAFWGFMFVVTCLVLVKLIFQHAHLTWPKYTLREFGSEFPFAFWWSINPFMIIVFTPLATAFTRHRSAFSCMVWGALITTGSVFILAASTSVAASVAFVVVLSIGEMLWSPRLYEYTSTIAPKGREASYMGLSQVPMFVAKPIVGFLSGWMLTNYCPETGPRSSQVMWLLIGIMTLVGPVLMLIFQRRFARQQETAPALATE